MTKSAFLEELKKRLGQLPKEEIERQLSYYSELIDDMMEDGMGEAEAVSRLGDIGEIAERILRETPLPKLMKSRMKPKNGWTALSVILLILGAPIWLPIVIVLMTVALVVSFVLWIVVVVVFAVMIAFAATGLALLVAAFVSAINSLPLALMLLGGGAACVGLGIFAFFGGVAAAKGLMKLTTLLFGAIKSLFIKKEGRI